MGLLSSKGPSEDPLSCSSLRSGSLGGVSPTDACVSLNFNRRAATSKGLAFSIAHVSPSPPVDAALRYYYFKEGISRKESETSLKLLVKY